MALSNAQGIVTSGPAPFPGSGAIPGTPASRISVAKTRQSYNGTAIPDSAVRSVTQNLRLPGAYPNVEGNITDV
jgi:hypothetical protein